MELGPAEFQGWYDDSRWVEGTPAADQWAAENMSSIQSKQDDKLPGWLAKPDKPVLFVQDGQ